MSADSLIGAVRPGKAPPPSIPADEAALWRVFAARRTLPPVAGRQVLCEAAPAPASDWFEVFANCAAGSARLLAPPQLIDDLLYGLAPEAVSSSIAWRLLLLELAFEPELTELARIDPKLDLSFSERGNCDAAFAFGLSINGLSLRVEADRSLAAAVGAHLRGAPPMRTPVPGLRLTLHAQAMAAMVSLAELRSLQPGDAVRAIKWSSDDVQLVAGEMFAWAAQREDARLQVIGKRRDARAELEEIWMQDETLPGEPEIAFDDLPVRLSFDLGSWELTLEELEALGPGHVLELRRAEADAIDIRANGRKIGAGRAVIIGGAVAVQIVRIGGK